MHVIPTSTLAIEARRPGNLIRTLLQKAAVRTPTRTPARGYVLAHQSADGYHPSAVSSRRVGVPRRALTRIGVPVPAGQELQAMGAVRCILVVRRARAVGRLYACNNLRS